MKLAAIVAAAEDNAIGIQNQMPWHLPNDLKYFKRITMGSPVLMGRKTFDSLGKPLPGRENIVITRQKKESIPASVHQVGSLEDGIRLMESMQAETGFIIGGGQIFKAAIPMVDLIYLTRVHAHFPEADVFFPDVDPQLFDCIESETHSKDERHLFDYSFFVYAKKKQ